MALYVTAARAGARALWAPSRVGLRLASTAADRAEVASRREADEALEKGFNAEAFKWRPVREVLQKPNLLDIDADAFINDGKPVNLEAEALRYDPEGELASSVGRLIELGRALQEQDVVHDVLKTIGCTSVGYRKNETRPINWEYYRQNIHPSSFVDNLKKAYEADSKRVEEALSEKNPRYQEVVAQLNLGKEEFNQTLAQLRQQAEQQIKGLEKIEKIKDQVLDFIARVETISVSDMVEEEKEAAAAIEKQMFEGRWGVDEVEIREVATGTAEEYPGTRSNPAPTDLPERFEKRL